MSELLDPPTLLKSEAVQLSLIGMSGAGKSYWSKRMESLGFQVYSCDDLIAERLGPVSYTHLTLPTILLV